MMGTGGIDVLDRDMSGSLVADHDNEGFSAWNATTTFTNVGKICGPQNGCGSYNQVQYGSFPVGYGNGNFGQFLQTRLDGYNDGYGNTFQGVRSQDSNAGQWSTPDAYIGDVRDPAFPKTLHVQQE